MDDVTTIGYVARQTLDAYEALAELAEDVEDEWTYVTDLSAAWRARVESVITERGGEPLDPPALAAVERAIDEIGRISDPHRAIDWLSTFPQVVLTTFGEQP
jgi:hypothetical protein